MKKLWVVLLVGVVVASMTSADAKTITRRTVVLSANPCVFVLCSYFLPHASDPTVAVTRVLSNENTDKELAFACTEPGIGDVYRDVVVTAPQGARLLVITYKPTIDWDGFICAKPKAGNNGRMLASESGSGANQEACQYSCPSFASTKVKPGTRYVIRAYNFSDYDSLKLTYTFSG